MFIFVWRIQLNKLIVHVSALRSCSVLLFVLIFVVFFLLVFYAGSPTVQQQQRFGAELSARGSRAAFEASVCVCGVCVCILLLSFSVCDAIFISSRGNILSLAPLTLRRSCSASSCCCAFCVVSLRRLNKFFRFLFAYFKQLVWRSLSLPRSFSLCHSVRLTPRTFIYLFCFNRIVFSFVFQSGFGFGVSSLNEMQKPKAAYTERQWERERGKRKMDGKWKY